MNIGPSLLLSTNAAHDPEEEEGHSMSYEKLP
jgi:hypothetical protein